MQENVPVTLITDNTAGSLLRSGEIDLVIVGTDRTARNGDVANKIGTYPLAVLSRVNRVPFYVAAPLSSIDFSIASGDLIPIEERNPDEVTTVLGKYPIAPDGVKARNIAFDVTPRKYITAIITEIGVFRPKDIRKLSRSSIDVNRFRIRAQGD
jgi:methylthioribose-1-phosphate isomerase